MTVQTTLRDELNDYATDLTEIKTRLVQSNITDRDSLVTQIDTTIEQLNNTDTIAVPLADLTALTTRVEHLTNVANTELLKADAQKV